MPRRDNGDVQLAAFDFVMYLVCESFLCRWPEWKMFHACLLFSLSLRMLHVLALWCRWADQIWTDCCHYLCYIQLISVLCCTKRRCNSGRSLWSLMYSLKKQNSTLILGRSNMGLGVKVKHTVFVLSTTMCFKRKGLVVDWVVGCFHNLTTKCR